MNEYMIPRILASLVFGGCIFALGMAIRLKRRPIIIPGKSFFLIFTLTLIPMYLQYLPKALQAPPVAMALMLFIMFGPLLLVKLISGDFMFFNVPAELLLSSLETVLNKHNITFKEGPTRGLLAPGVDRKGGKIATLDFPELGASVRYLLNKQLALGNVKFMNKKNVPDMDGVIEDLKVTLRYEEVPPARSHLYIIAFGAFSIVFQVFRYLR